RNQRESPLLRLPAEVRSMVWEYVFGGYHIYVYPREIHRRILRLMTVCRQIFMEAVLLPFRLNTWHI
ncbi:hypothetical protein COCMIDRAFT_54347, partial [Bipolaris oryzae ATCC 44560]